MLCHIFEALVIVEVEVDQAVEAVGVEESENGAEQEGESDIDFEDICESQEPWRTVEHPNNDDLDELEDFLEGFDDDELIQCHRV